MNPLRAALRLLAIGTVTAVLYPPYLLASAVAFPARGPAAAARDGVFGLWARLVATLVGMRIETRGAAPGGPYFLVCNHLSYLDIVVLARCAQGVFVAKSDVAGWPILGRLARTAHTIFVDRTRKSALHGAIAAIDAALDAGRGVILFPEGTSTSGRSVLPFKSSLLEPAARRRVAVHTASLSYRTPPGAPCASESVCWWGDMTLAPHLWALLGMRGFRATLTFGREPVTDHDRHALARRVRDAVAAHFIPVVTDPPPPRPGAVGGAEPAVADRAADRAADRVADPSIAGPAAAGQAAPTASSRAAALAAAPASR